MGAVILLTIFIVVIITVIRFFGSSVPSTSFGDTERFKGSLPEGFGYPYFLDGTGHAVNVKDRKLLVFANGKQHIYGSESIRGFKYGMDGADQIYLTGKASLGTSVNTALKNRSMRKDAYESSGIFVEVADIDTPVLQIRYSSETDMRRSVEILQQFLDGTLMDYEEYLKRRQQR